MGVDGDSHVWFRCCIDHVLKVFSGTFRCVSACIGKSRPCNAMKEVAPEMINRLDAEIAELALSSEHIAQVQARLARCFVGGEGGDISDEVLLIVASEYLKSSIYVHFNRDTDTEKVECFGARFATAERDALVLVLSSGHFSFVDGSYELVDISDGLASLMSLLAIYKYGDDSWWEYMSFLFARFVLDNRRLVEDITRLYSR